MRFGVALPTCTEGMAYPLPFGDHTDVVDLARHAEELGFDSLLVNDHISTQNYVRETFSDPPRYYEPLVTLGYLSAATSQIRLMTGVVVLPLRDPVVLAKQVATLDNFSGGRLTLGVGVGSYREEFEAVRPEIRDAPRARLVVEGLEALHSLFEDRVSSYDGDYVRFNDVELYPKPLQHPLPILSSGNADATIRRAATLCNGWMSAGLPFERFAAGVTALRRFASEKGRDVAKLEIAPQLTVCIASSTRAATDAFERSQLFEHLVSLQQSTLRGISPDDFIRENLIGTPDDVCTHIERLAAAGATELAGMLFVANTSDELAQQMTLAATEVLPAFR